MAAWLQAKVRESVLRLRPRLMPVLSVTHDAAAAGYAACALYKCYPSPLPLTVT